MRIKNNPAVLALLALGWLAAPAFAQITVTGADQAGVVPFTPSWIRANGSLIAGTVPSVANGNFSQYTGANANNLTQPGIPLTINAFSSPQATNLEVCGNDGTAGALLVYTLPVSTYGYDLTNITVYGGWQDNGRDAQAYTISYSTAANPGSFLPLTQVNYSPAGVPGGVASANRVIINDASGNTIARSVAALKFDFTSPPSENNSVGYTAITVQGVPAASFTAPPIAITASNQNSVDSFTPTWTIETNSLIARQSPAVFGTGNFAVASGATGLGALTDGTVGNVGTPANYATCGTNAGQSITYSLHGATLTNIVVYSGWQNGVHDGQFYDIAYSTLAAPANFIPLASINYNPAVTGFSANRVAIGSSIGVPLATNVAFVKFNFTVQSAGLDGGYSGYAEIILQGATNSAVQPAGGASPIPEPYAAVSSGAFSGPAVPLSPDPLVAYRWPRPQGSDGLEVYLIKPVAVTADTNASFANLHSLTTDNPNVTVQGAGSIQMDFGQENAGWLEFDSPDLTGDVTMSISEYNRPEISMMGGANFVKTLTPIKYGNTYRLELNSQLYEGVRFGWIHVNSFSSAWHITGLRLVCQTKPANYNGSFSCSDPMLTRIWYVGAYTVKLNLLNSAFGAVLVDRGDRISWTGDAYCSQAASLAAFGNYDFIKQNLAGTANDDNGIASYSLCWVLSLMDYYNYTGDTAMLGTYLTNAMAKLDGAYANYGTNPNLTFYGWDERLGAGFQNASCTESQDAYKMLSIRAWEQFAATMGAYGRADLQAKYYGYANEKLATLRQNSVWYQGFSLHACADAANTGLLNDSEKNAIFAQEFTGRANRISYSPFNEYFVIQALAAMDKDDDALSSINDLWGSEINYGGTTFFELSRPSWNAGLGLNDPVPNAQCGFTSLCHPWSAGVVKWLSEEVLGIKPASPGFATYQILPHLGRTLTYVTGTATTPLGSIQASFNVSNGLCTISAPVGTVGKIGIPKVEKTISGITINGVLAWDGAYHSVAGIGGASEDSEFVYFTGVQPGTNSFSVSYAGSTPTYTAPPDQFAAQFVKEDALTSGNWGGVYGKDGYALCNYNGNGNDKKFLPPYVASINYFMIYGNGLPNAVVWATATNDTRALASDASNQNLRNAACVYTDKDVGGRNTMTFTINTAGTRNYQVALYFVDWDNQDRRLAVEMFDANTLDLVAPVRVVTNFSGGKYLVYTYNKSVKFRIDHVWGDNAVLSGIFFDSGPTNLFSLNNNSFELDAASPGQVVTTVPAGWTAFNEGAPSDIGSQNAGGTDYMANNPLAAPAAGNQYCYINMFNPNVTGGIYQDVGKLLPNTTYSLTVAIGSRADRINSPGIISLLNGTNQTGTVLASGGGRPETQNTWRNYTVTYTTGPSVSGDLTVELSALGNATSIQADFDNVQLTATPVVIKAPGLATPKISDANLILTGTGGTPSGGYTWLTTTNLSDPGNWKTSTIGTLDGSGSFSNAIPLSTSQPAGFFKLRMP
ncbi:MAG TPA: alpha-L-rhamnosidase C-terminal domain-containing protein [Verrucomicrobiae bacterium]|nr:alpha-L-rhamnosidase C-terminal domain-containing protein [Verrucomicrobiae bacterium]